MVRATLLLIAAALLASASAIAQDKPATTPPSSARAGDSMPHDTHGGMTVSALPWTDSARAKNKFGKANPLPTGILPVEVLLRNDTGNPIQIGLETIQLDVHLQGSRLQELDWLAPEEVARRIAHPGGDPVPKMRRFPIGMRAIGDKKVSQLAALLQPLALDADVVPPNGTIHGFLFFDLNHDLSLAAHSSLYLPDATVIPSKQPLIFFEVPLGEP